MTVAVVGVGLIGTSFGLALRSSGFTGDILGVSSPPAIRGAMERGAITAGVSLEKAAECAELIFLSQTVERILETIEILGSCQLAPHCLITDAGSTKQQIVECAGRFLPANTFIGGHPIAGKEQRGPQAADGSLFRDRPYVLTPTFPVPVAFRDRLLAMGANVLEMTPREHDTTLAFTSHLPQLLSTALGAALFRQNSPHISSIFGSGLLDMTRLALSTPEIWASILKTNESAVSDALTGVIDVLREMQTALQKGDLAYMFDEANAFARKIRHSAR